jgi:hypothetical protein
LQLDSRYGVLADQIASLQEHRRLDEKIVSLRFQIWLLGYLSDHSFLQRFEPTRTELSVAPWIMTELRMPLKLVQAPA